MNMAFVTDRSGQLHNIECDFLSVSEGFVLLYVDYRGPKSNRVEIKAAFFQPIEAKLRDNPLRPGTSIYPE